MTTMTLAHFAGKQSRNYSQNPTINVEILTDETRHCSTCGEPALRTNPENLYGLPEYAHVEPTLESHRITLRAVCAYCGSDEHIVARQHAWYDAAECSRCGGVTGWAIGD